MIAVETARILLCCFAGITASALAVYFGFRYGYARGLRDGKLSISRTHAYDMGRKAGQRETAQYLAGSDIPIVRAAGKALQADGWGR